MLRRQKFLVFQLRKQNPEKSSNEELLPLDFIAKENVARRGGYSILSYGFIAIPQSFSWFVLF
jgi:hypothetical protein